MHGYEAPKGALKDSIISILLAHCERSVNVSKADRERLANQVLPFAKNQQPIPISISLAIGVRIPNPLKFTESDNLPTYSWMHFGNFLSLINEKVQRVYQPGIKVVVFDEATLFGPMIGILAESTLRHLRATEKLLKAVQAPVKIIPLTQDLFPQSEVDKITSTVGDDKVYSVVCSRQDMKIPEVMDPLYTDRQHRSYADLRRLLGGTNIWDDSKRMAEMIARHLEYRKKVGLFERLAGPVAVDATVTDKDGRVVFDVTSPALFNHAMPIVRRSQDGNHKVQIEPEYRIRRLHPTAKSVKIDKSELSNDKGLMTFYYLNN